MVEFFQKRTKKACLGRLFGRKGEKEGKLEDFGRKVANFALRLPYSFV